MSQNLYNDGFPNDAAAAIEFSYFLSEAERQEWREWLSVAKPEQQVELIKILHQMWESAKADEAAAALANPAMPTAPRTETIIV